jgi:large subunit ribosomal protein L9
VTGTVEDRCKSRVGVASSSPNCLGQAGQRTGRHAPPAFPDCPGFNRSSHDQIVRLKGQENGSHPSRTHRAPRPDGRHRQGQGRFRTQFPAAQGQGAARQRSQQEEVRRSARQSEAEAVAEKLDGTTFIVVRSAGETGQLYGSVSTRDIADFLAAEGFNVARNQVELNHPIKTIGLTTIAIALHPEVEVTITLNIARSTDEAERQARGEMLTTAEAIYGEDINENARPDNFFDPNAEFEEGEEEA